MYWSEIIIKECVASLQSTGLSNFSYKVKYLVQIQSTTTSFFNCRKFHAHFENQLSIIKFINNHRIFRGRSGIKYFNSYILRIQWRDIDFINTRIVHKLFNTPPPLQKKFLYITRKISIFNINFETSQTHLQQSTNICILQCPSLFISLFHCCTWMWTEC